MNIFVESRDQETRDDIVLRLYRIWALETACAPGSVLPSRDAVRRMGKWLREPYYFELFRRHHPMLEGKIEYTDKPDIVLHGVRKIGIELTNFFKEDGRLSESEQRQSVTREEVVSRAQRIYLENGGRGIRLFVAFDKASPIGDRPDQEELAEQIAALASRIDVRHTGPIDNEAFEDVPELSFVYLISEEYADSEWRVQQAHRGVTLSRDELATIIRRKEKKARRYQPCDAYWLIVIVDFMDSAQDQEVRLDGFRNIASPVFERIYVFRTVVNHVLQVTGAM